MDDGFPRPRAQHSSAGVIAWCDIENVAGDGEGEFDAPCPVCGPDRRSGSNRDRKVLRIWRSEPDFATYYCARCGVRGWVIRETDQPTQQRGALWRAMHGLPSTDPKKEAEEQARKMAFAEFVYLGADPIEETLAARYLASRRLQPGLDLRFTPLAPFSYDRPSAGPAMVAAVRDTAGVLIGAQVAHLNPDGSKLRRTCFGRIGGGAVRLAAVGADRVLAVAEGVETALSFSDMFSVPTWAAISAVGIEQFEPPAGLSRLVIAADNDTHGRGLEAAQRLAKRACGSCEVVISLPAKVGMEIGAGVVLLSHPSLSGISSGSGLSGSTAWNNSVRSRLYMTRPTIDGGDPELRILSHQKANYGPRSEDIRIVRKAGAFEAIDAGAGTGLGGKVSRDLIDGIFVKLLTMYAAQGRRVSDQPGSNFAPTVFAKDPLAAGATKRGFGAAMNRLFAAGKIKVEEVGPASKRRRQLVIASPTEGDA